MGLDQRSISILETTSRTFFIPIMGLPGRLRDAVGSAYLCMRAIDEIEDHAALPADDKTRLLRAVSTCIQGETAARIPEALDAVFADDRSRLPEVTLRVGAHAAMAPPAIAHRIWDATSAMADRMAAWVERRWAIHSERDLDAYTYGVAGAIGLLLCDLWSWFDGTESDRGQAIGYGRGLQAVNILRNRTEDLARGVDYYPDGWQFAQMEEYVRRQLAQGDEYLASLPPGPAREFCRIPLALAYGTMDALASGVEKLDRAQVMALIEKAGRAV